ncbi:MAG: SEC-C metal-binding domain-containing protein [Cyclobacteriaceae bacterium]
MSKKVGRNDKCPCGSGKKYKRCCINSGKFSNAQKSTSSAMTLNKSLNRYESSTKHLYPSIDHTPDKVYSHDAKAVKGMIKCRLIHTEANSIILPDYIFYDTGWIQPLNFTAPLISKLDEKTIVTDFSIGIQNGITIKLRYFNSGYIKSYPDKSQLFECEIYGPEDLADYLSGDFIEENNQILLKQYHHTNQKGHDGILGSKSLWSSVWNYKGNKEVVNHSFVYFTHIPQIKFDSDLMTVAMAADGNLHYTVDSFIPPVNMSKNQLEKFKDSIYTAEVYKATAGVRDKTLEFYVPVNLIDAKHIYKHAQHTVFYEICFPYIHRIRMAPKSVLHFNAEMRVEPESNTISGEYLIVGDATTKDGLAAPFEEEETKFVFKFEDCEDSPLPEFWIEKSNQDHFSNKEIELMDIKEVEDNPAKIKSI